MPPQTSPDPRRQLAATPNDVLAFLSPAGLVCCTGAAALWLYSLHVGRRASELRGATPVDSLTDLHGLLLPALVAIRGRVNSYASKKCELSDKEAVIHEVLEEEVWRKQRAEGRTTYEPFETRKLVEQAEWFVEDGSGVRVKVETALQADGLRSAMEVQSEFVGEDLSRKTLGNVLLEKAWQMTKVGVRKTERYLPVGAVVTCVGELHHNHIAALPSTAAAANSQAPGASHPSPSHHSSGNSPPPSHTTPGMPAALDSSHAHMGASSDEPAGSSSRSRAGGQGLNLAMVVGPLTGAASSFLHSADKAPASHTGTSSSLPSNHDSSPATAGRHRGSCTDMPYVLRKPTGKEVSYITPLTVDLLHASLSSTARTCRWLAAALGAVGATLLLRKAVARLLQLAHERRVRQRVAAVEAAKQQRLAAQRLAGHANDGPTASSSFSISNSMRGDGVRQGTDMDREPGTCVVCLEAGVQVVFTPCGHLCCCEDCGLPMDRCPLCRLRGKPTKVYLP